MTKLLQAETWSPVFTPRRVKAVDGNSFHLLENETLGLVGESDSGKTVASLPIMRLIGNPGEDREREDHLPGGGFPRKERARDVPDPWRVIS